MTKIHHATIKSAEAKGIVLEVKDDGEGSNAIFATSKSGTQVASDPKRAVELAVLADMLHSEYPAVQVSSYAGGVEFFHADLEDVVTTLIEVEDPEDLPDLSDLLQYCEDADLDPTLGYEEPADTATVVGDHYKKEYAARGDASCNSDWLAKLLKNQFSTETWPDFQRFLKGNGIDTDYADKKGKRWARGFHDEAARTNGWFGRIRMNGGQLLRRRICETGHVIDLEGIKIVADRDFLEELLEKFPDVTPEWAE